MAVGLVTGVALWSSVQLINDHAQASYSEADHLLGAESSYWIRSRQGPGIAVGDYIELRRNGFTEVYPVIESRVITVAGKVIPIVATDLLALPLTDYGSGASASSPFAGNNWLSFIQPNYQTWYSAELATRLGIAAGDIVELTNGHKMPTAVIQSRQQQGARAFMDIGAAFSVLGEEQFSYLSVTSLDPVRRQRLEALLPETLILVENQQVLNLTQLTESLHTHLTAMGLLSFAVGLFIVFNAVRFSLLTRQTTFNTLRELGVSVVMIGTAIILETIIWSLLGTLGGVVVGYFLSGILLPTVASSLQSLYGAIVGSNIQLNSAQLLIAWLMTLLGLVFALAGPLWVRLGMKVIDGRSNSVFWHQDEQARTMMMWFSLFLAMLGLGWFFRIESVVDGFLVLTFILFAGAFMLPAVIHSFIRIAQKYLPEAKWKWRWATSDAFAQLPHLRIALIALLLTLTANIGVTTLVGSFRDALSDWLELRLSADIYVQSELLKVDDLDLSATTDWLSDSHQRVGVSTRWHDRPARIQGVDADAPDISSMKLVEATTDGFASWVESGNEISEALSLQPILANEQVKYLGGAMLGDIITLGTTATKYNYEIVGFFHDYGSPYYRFYLPHKVVSSRWQDLRSEGIALWVKPGAQLTAEKALIEAGVKPGEWIQQSNIKRISLEIFDRTFAITAVLNSLTLIVAGVALLAALLAVHQQRLPEYAHWHSLGMTFIEWLTLVAIPLGLMVLITGLLSLPLGWILSWMLVYKLNVVAFGWTMPLVWSWWPVAGLSVVMLFVVAIALSVAALQVKRRLPEALKQLGGVGL